MTVPIDSHLFILSLLVTVGLQLSAFSVAAYCKFDKITDLTGSTNFVLLALLSLVVGAGADPAGVTPRRLVATAVVCASRAELALFLFIRVMKRGKDSRFDGMREKFWNFLGFWVFQIIWVYGVSLPVLYINTQAAPSDRMSTTEIVGAILAGAGFLFECVADVHKFIFRSNPGNEGRACTTGLWAWSRHPNYFGEILGWWGVFVMTVPVIRQSGSTVGYVCLLSPLLTMVFLLLLSGLPTAEGAEQAKYMRTPASAEAYTRYRERTSIVLPLPPALYSRLPRCAKIALFDLPWFEYEPGSQHVIV